MVFCSDQSADAWLIREIGVLQKEGKTPQVSFDAVLVDSGHFRDDMLLVVCPVIPAAMSCSSPHNVHGMFGLHITVILHTTWFPERTCIQHKEELSGYHSAVGSILYRHRVRGLAA